MSQRGIPHLRPASQRLGGELDAVLSMAAGGLRLTEGERVLLGAAS